MGFLIVSIMIFSWDSGTDSRLGPLLFGNDNGVRGKIPIRKLDTCPGYQFVNHIHTGKESAGKFFVRPFRRGAGVIDPDLESLKITAILNFMPAFS